MTGFDSWQRQGFSLPHGSHNCEWIPGYLLLEVERLEHEADLSPPSGAEVKIVWSHTAIALGRLY
jgi:hypothetical protein